MSIVGLIFFAIALAVFLSSLLIGDWDTQEIAEKMIIGASFFLLFAVCADIVMALILTMIGG